MSTLKDRGQSDFEVTLNGKLIIPPANVIPAGTNGPIKDAAGNIYGITSHGGALNYGTIFRIDSRGASHAALAEQPKINVPILMHAVSNKIDPRILAQWQGPINFYGKVVDQNSNPVESAAINFQWAETPTDNGNRSANTMSDAQGLFSLTGQLGLELNVSVGKKGYYSSQRDCDFFDYGRLRGPSFPANPTNPVIFHLKKKEEGVALITSEHGMQSKVGVHAPRDNVPVWIDLFQKKAGAAGQLKISQIKPPWQTATNWSCSLSIPDGGLIENQDEYQFRAPTIGYQRTVEYNFSKNETNWKTQIIKQFYIAFGEPRKHGWLRIESNLAQETVFLTYAINPTGSQNLEPSQ